MNLLALELSSPQGSVCVACDQTVLASRAWMQRAFRSEHLFSALTPVLREAGLAMDEIDVFVAGRGPGNYSGMRVALTTAQALALPGGKPVFALSSGEALAAEILDTRGVPNIAVIGDARRGHCWLGLFARATPLPEKRGDWKLVARAEMAAALAGTSLTVSSEPERLQELVIGEAVFPNAARLAALAHLKLQAGMPSEELTPIYLHPAV